MRARYAAFATGAIDFIVASTHSRTRGEIDARARFKIFVNGHKHLPGAAKRRSHW